MGGLQEEKGDGGGGLQEERGDGSGRGVEDEGERYRGGRRQ